MTAQKATQSSASILAHLLELAKQRGEDYSLLLNRFALERLLCRLSESAYANSFLLKGAMLFSLWYGQPYRPTRDVDLLGFGEDGAAHLLVTFREIASMDLADGIVFDTASLRIEPIREYNSYGGSRISMLGKIGSARCTVQIDVGFGDAVTPEPQTVWFPVLLQGFASPKLRVYPVYTVIAEKYHAMVILELASSRMKDFYDLLVIAQRSDLQGDTLAQAIAATFKRRATALPTERPLALTSVFHQDAAKQLQWKAFSGKNRLPVDALEQVVILLEKLLWHPTQAALEQAKPLHWKAEHLAWQ